MCRRSMKMSKCLQVSMWPTWLPGGGQQTSTPPLWAEETYTKSKKRVHSDIVSCYYCKRCCFCLCSAGQPWRAGGPDQEGAGRAAANGRPDSAGKTRLRTASICWRILEQQQQQKKWTSFFFFFTFWVWSTCWHAWKCHSAFLCNSSGAACCYSQLARTHTVSTFLIFVIFFWCFINKMNVESLSLQSHASDA